MAHISLPPFAPDVASLDAAVTALATNVLPRADGYGPVRGPVPITLALPGACRGAISIQSPLYGYTTYFAGTRDRLYRYDLSTQGWIDATGTSAVGVAPNAFWSFSLYGNRLVATPTSGPTLVIDVDRGKTFEPLGGMPPRAKFNGVVGGFLVLANLASAPNGLQWSDLEDIERWTPGAAGQSGDLQIQPDGGAITGFAGGEFGVVFQERAIRRMIFSGSATVFDFSIAEQNRGCVSPSALVSVGGQVFFVDREGFFVFRGDGAVPIGAERVNRFFLSRVDPNALAGTLAHRDPTGSRVLFSYRSTNAPADELALLDETLIYDWSLDRWAFLSLPLTCGLPAATPGTSIDALSGSVDAMTKSFDSPDYLGGSPGLGLFGSDRRLAILNGPTIEARVGTADAMLARPNRAFVRGLRLDSDADAWRVRIGTRETLRGADPVRWSDEAAADAELFAPFRASGRYHRAEIRIPAATAWSYASAIEADATAEGMR